MSGRVGSIKADHAGRSRRVRLGVLALFGASLAAAGLALVADAAPPPAFAATASVSSGPYYIGDAAGSIYTFTVTNTGTSSSIGAVEIDRPDATWTVTGCPGQPTGWSAQTAAPKCRFRSAAATGDDILPGQSRTFMVRATTAPGTTNRSGTWTVVVSKNNQFDTPSLLRTATPATSGALTTTLYTFELTPDPVVTDTMPLTRRIRNVAAPNTACPAANKDAITGSRHNIVVCGRNHATVALTPNAANSSLSGTFIASAGTFVSGSIPANSGIVVLARWDGTDITGTFGNDKTVRVKIGSASNRTSPLPYVEFTGYHALNQPPVANDDSYTTDEDTPLTVAAPGVLGNDTDPDGDPITASLQSDVSHGTLTLNADGSFSYTPDADFNGDDTFTYVANDGHTDSAPATVTIHVTPVQDAPVAHDVTTSTDEDTPVTVTMNGTDADGDALTYHVSTGPSHGTLGTITGNQVQYTPDADYHGPDSFTYYVNDGTANSSDATVHITVNSVNDAPVAVNDAYSTDEDTPLSIAAPGVLANDTDADGDGLTSVLDTDVSHGDLTLNADGSFTYTPDADFHGPDSFTYHASDGTAASNTATVSLTVNAVNDAPVAVNDAYSTDEDTPLSIAAPGVLTNDTDADGDGLTSVLDTDVSHGDLTLNADGSFSYTPDPNYHGPDSFTYHANDGTADSNIVTVSLTVNSVNDAPVATDDGPYTVTEGTPLVVAAPGVLANDTDVDGDGLTASTSATPDHGDITLNSDGSFTYTPDAGYTGTDSVDYQASDGTASDTATISFTVVPPNATPTADDVPGASGNEDTVIPITLTGHDADGDPLTFTVGTPAYGTLGTPYDYSCDGNTPSLCTEKVDYTPGADYNGTDGFTYHVNDGTVDSADANVSITITAVNDAPSFTKGADQTVAEDSGPASVSGWATNISPGPTNEGGQTVTFVVAASNTALFSAQPAVASDGTLTFTPAANAFGSTSVDIYAHDDGGTANSGVDNSPVQSFLITITAVNDAPSFTKGGDQTVAEDAGAQTVSNWATGISAGPNEGGQTVHFEVTANTNPGLFSAGPAVAADGTLTYTSATDKWGTASITLVAKDDGGTSGGGADTSAPQTFDITVTAVNDAPTAAPHTYAAQANMKIHLGGLLTGAADAHDVAGNASWSPTFSVDSITVGAGCVGCTVSNVDPAAGTFDFDPPAGGASTYTFSYTIVDDGEGTPSTATSAPATITVNVSGPVIWFVDAAASPGGTGRLSAPFQTIAGAAAVDAANHRIFVAPGTYSDGITLNSGEWLTGSGAKATDFDTLMGITPPSGTIARPAINTTAPTVNGGVVLGSGNTVRGLTLSGAPALSGTSFGTLTLGSGANADVTLSSTGTALSLSTGTISGDFLGTTSSGGTNNVNLNTVATTGTSLGSGALSAATGAGFRVTAGAGTFTYSGTVSNASSGAAVDVSNMTGGSVSLSGAVNDTSGAGVALSSNTGATISLTGGVTLSSGTSPAFAATGGGTVNVTGSANTITSTTGTALNIANTTIGASNVTFRSIDSNGAANGIVLNNTGTSGHLAVTGTGSGTTGGIITAPTGVGVSLTSTKDVALSYVKVLNSGSHGIQGSGVNGLTLTSVQVLGAGDADNERAVDLTNSSGTVTITGGTYDDSSDDLVHMEQTNTNVTLNVSGSATFSNLTQATANNAFTLKPDGTSAITASITNSTFSNLKGSSVNLGAAAALSSGSSSLTFTGNTVNGGAQGGAGIVVSGQENTVSTTTISSNTFTGAGGNGVVNHDANDNSLIKATIQNNTFTSPKGHAIVGEVDETADTRMLITGNTVTNAPGDGIQLVNFGDDSAPNLTSTASFIVTNNTINGHSQNAGIASGAGAINIFNFENDGDTTCANITGNTVTGTPAGYFDIYLQDGAATAGAFIYEENPNTPATGDVADAYIFSKNPGTTALNDVNAAGVQYSNGVTCALP